eukprot:CAMPEP_0204529300 /NCGR_PEP_ID=MMETSP0661-20131031/9990_1 /ASSEMBLY_ACC=CAM_ASM_000606 /TAXON_ID=109239 /ORGANISM="Alexandrium margalefi, Strain AMGDE01CS-322" /LENGTH=275 /DNA_ID=CAMNT_0051535317 /DNA_START=133 /DNA_END=960 /DNA_ORIENTATION=-
MAELLLEVCLDFLPDGGSRTEDAMLRARYNMRCIAGFLRDLAMRQPPRQGLTAIEPAVVAGGVPAATACEKAGQWPNALALSALPQSRLSPDVITYNAAISACVKAGQGQRALVFSAALPQSFTAPDAITYKAAINACEAAGQGQRRALAFSAVLAQSPTAPDVITCNAAFTAPSRGTGDPSASWDNCEGDDGPLPALVPLGRPRTRGVPKKCLQVLLSFRKGIVAWELEPMGARKKGLQPLRVFLQHAGGPDCRSVHLGHPCGKASREGRARSV